MRPPRINEGAAFGPEVLNVVAQAFDEAWASIADKFSPAEHAQARDDLADAIMNAARDDSDDVARVRDTGVRAVQLKYPSRFGGLPQTGQGNKIG